MGITGKPSVWVTVIRCPASATRNAVSAAALMRRIRMRCPGFCVEGCRCSRNAAVDEVVRIADVAAVTAEQIARPAPPPTPGVAGICPMPGIPGMEPPPELMERSPL